MKLRRIEQICLEKSSSCRLVCRWFLGSCEVSWTEHCVSSFSVQMNHQHQPVHGICHENNGWAMEKISHWVSIRSIWICCFCWAKVQELRPQVEIWICFLHEMCKICQQHVQNPGIITLREGDYINSILRRWGRGFFRCSDCYFNDRCSKQKCCVDLLKCNVKYATVIRGLAIWNDYINSRNTGKRLPVFHSHGFHTAIFMDEEQIWTPQLFIADQPALKRWFFQLGAMLKIGIVLMYSKPIPAFFRRRSTQSFENNQLRGSPPHRNIVCPFGSVWLIFLSINSPSNSIRIPSALLLRWFSEIPFPKRWHIWPFLAGYLPEN